MERMHHYRGIAWVTLVAVVVGFQPWDAMARPGSAASDRSTPRSSPAKNPSRQYITIPAAPAALPAAKIPVIQKPVATAPTVAPAGPVTYDQLRGAAVEAELKAQKAQSSYNQAAAAYNMESSNIKAFAQKAGYVGLLHPPLGTPVTGSRWKGFDEVSKPQVRGGLAVTDGSMDVRPCNQILGITLPSWVGRKFFKTSYGNTFSTYDEAKSSVLKIAASKSNIVIYKGIDSAEPWSPLGDSYSKCLDIEAMSADLDFSKKLLDKIALNDAVAWHSVIEKYSIAASQYQEATQAWQAAEAKLIDLIAKMILKAEASDSKLEGLAIDAYGFWIASKLRYHYMTGYSKSLLPSESAIFDKLQIQKIFQDYSNGKVDTTDYRTSLYDLFNTATGPAPSLRLDRAFGFAAAYAASLKSQLTLTERVAQAAIVAAEKAATGKAAAEKAAPIKSANSSGWNFIGQEFNKATALSASNPDQLQAPVLPPLDPMVSALSSRLTEVLFMLAVPVLDRTKLYGVTPTWLFITNAAYPMDNYFFALKDQSKSAVVMNGGFDIYDNAAGWHKMQIKWKAPSKKTPQDFFDDEYPYLVYLEKKIPYPADGSCPHVKINSLGAPAFHLFGPCLVYLSQYRIAESYFAKAPIYEVLSQSGKLQDKRLNEKIGYWSDKEQKYIDKVSVSTVIPKFLMEVTNAFGINAAAMLFIRGKSPEYYQPIVQKADKSGNLLLDLRGWKYAAHEFSNYTGKAFQAEKAAGYPYVKSAEYVTNFSSIAFLFNPVSVGFGSCSIYETLFSPYDTQLGYSCIDYMRPLLELYKPSKKTSTLFRDLKRLNQWVADQIIPNANAEEYIGIEKSDDGGSGGGIIAVTVTLILSYLGIGSDNKGSGGGGGGAKSASEIQEMYNKQSEQNKQQEAQKSAAEAKQIETGQKAIEKYIEGAQQVAKVVSDYLKKLFELPPIDSKEFNAINPDSPAMQGKAPVNNAQAKSLEAGELAEQVIETISTMNDRPITAPINYNGKMYYPKMVGGVRQSGFMKHMGAMWYTKRVSVTYQSLDGSTVTEEDTFLLTDYTVKVGEEKTIIQGVYKVVFVEGNDKDNATTIFLELETILSDGSPLLKPDGSNVIIEGEVIDNTFIKADGIVPISDPATAQKLQDQIDAWVKKHP